MLTSGLLSSRVFIISIVNLSVFFVAIFACNSSNAYIGRQSTAFSVISYNKERQLQKQNKNYINLIKHIKQQNHNSKFSCKANQPPKFGVIQ